MTQRRSTSAIIASCKRKRSASNSSAVLVDLTRCGWPMITCTLANARGTMNRSQLFIGHTVPIRTPADQSRAVTVRKKKSQHDRKYQQAIMPESADVIFIHRLSNNASAIIDLVTQRTRPKLEQAKSERDQPTRAPTFDLQLFLPEVFAV